MQPSLIKGRRSGATSTDTTFVNGQYPRPRAASRGHGRGVVAALPLATLALMMATAIGSTGCDRAAAAGAPPVDSTDIIGATAVPPRETVIVAATTALAEEVDVVRTLSLTGTLLPNRKSEVAADATGKVAATFVERGSFIKKGAPLVRLDQSSALLVEQEAAAHAAATRSQSLLARTECMRAQRLFDAGAINRAEFDRSQTQCEAASFTLTAASMRVGQARKTLADALVRAPFSGEIAERLVTEGEFVRPDTRVVTLVELDTLRLELTVPETAVAQVSREQEVGFSVAAFPDQTFRGRVRFVGASVRRSSRDLLVEAVVPNGDRRLRPGMFATAQLTLGQQRLTVIPSAAVRHQGGGRSGANGDPERIFVVSGGRAEERLIQTGDRQGDRVVVMEGIRPGERVVTNPPGNIRDGVLLR